MGRTIVVVIIILLSLACGALGWEVMRQQSDKQDLQREVQALQTRLTALEAPKFEPPQRKWATEEMINDLSTHLQSLDKKTQDLLASQQELDKKLAALKESGVVAKSGQGSPVDIPNMTEEQKEALREMVKKESDARDMQRANMIKSMVKQRFNQEIPDSTPARNRRKRLYTHVLRHICSTSRPLFLAKQTSLMPLPWADRRLSIVAKAPSRAALRG